jgi:VanZ family protein
VREVPFREHALAWLPVALWLCVVMTFSQSTFSAEWTQRGIGPLVKYFGFTPEQALMIRFAIRKGAHVSEYAVLGFLALRAAALALPFPRAAVLALAVALGIATVDEWHQAYEPFRTGRPADVALDLAGAACGVAVRRLLVPPLR